MIENNLIPGDTRTIIADTPALGYLFSAWTGDTTALADPSASTTVVTMPDADIDVTATYAVNWANVKYGALYNWYAATDVRKITSSDDWIVASMSNWVELFNFIETGDGYYPTVGGKLKEIGLTHWIAPNTGATNEYGFNVRGCGTRYVEDDGEFLYLNEAVGIMVTDISEDDPTQHKSLYFDTNITSVSTGAIQEFPDGQVIRLCNPSITTENETGYYVGNDGKQYKYKVIGGIAWLIENLNETKYRNGDYIHGFEGGVYTPISNANWAALTTEGMCVYNDDLNNV